MMYFVLYFVFATCAWSAEETDPGTPLSLQRHTHENEPQYMGTPLHKFSSDQLGTQQEGNDPDNKDSFLDQMEERKKKGMESNPIGEYYPTFSAPEALPYYGPVMTSLNTETSMLGGVRKHKIYESQGDQLASPLEHYNAGYVMPPHANGVSKYYTIFFNRLLGNLTSLIMSLKIKDEGVDRGKKEKDTVPHVTLRVIKQANEKFVPPPARQIVSILHGIGELALYAYEEMKENEAEIYIFPLYPTTTSRVDIFSQTLANILASFLNEFINNFTNEYMMLPPEQSVILLEEAVLDNLKYHIMRYREAKKPIQIPQLIIDVMQNFQTDHPLKAIKKRERIIGMINGEAVTAMDILIGSFVSVHIPTEGWKACELMDEYECIAAPEGDKNIKKTDEKSHFTGSSLSKKIVYHIPKKKFYDKQGKQITRRVPNALAKQLGFELPIRAQYDAPLDRKSSLEMGLFTAKNHKKGKKPLS